MGGENFGISFMKNRRGEIATLLTLGLVLIGTAVTIATSFITNSRNNIASNPRASVVNCTFTSSTSCSMAIKMGECPQTTGVCSKCVNGNYRCPGTSDDSTGSSVRTPHNCPAGSLISQYWEAGGKFYKTATSTTSYTTSAAACGTPPTSSCVGTAKYQTCKDINAAYTTGGYYSNNGKYFEDSKCKNQISIGPGNYCKSKNPTDGGQQIPDVLCCRVYDCKNGKQQIKAIGKVASPSNGNVGYTSCSTTGYPNVSECSTIPGAPTTNGADAYVNCSSAPPIVDPGTGSGPTGGSEVGPGQSCCFTKKGLIYEYATYQSMVNNTIPLDCSRQTAAFVKSYQALDPPGAFVCQTGSAGLPYDDSPIIDPEEPILDPPTECVSALNFNDCQEMATLFGINMTYRTTSKMCCPQGVDPPTGGNTGAVSKVDYDCPGTSGKVYWLGSDNKYYSSKSDTTGESTFNNICYGSCSGPNNCIGDDNTFTSEINKDYYLKSVSGKLTYYENSSCGKKIGAGDLNALKTFCTSGGGGGGSGGGLQTGTTCHVSTAAITNYGSFIDKPDDPITGTAPCGGVLVQEYRYGSKIFRECPTSGNVCRYTCFASNGSRENCKGVADIHGGGIRKVTVVNNTNREIEIRGEIKKNNVYSEPLGLVSISPTAGSNYYARDFSNVDGLKCALLSTIHFKVYYRFKGDDAWISVPEVQERCAGTVNLLISIK